MDKPMYDRTMVETDISLSLVPMVIVSAFMIAISCRGCSMGGGAVASTGGASVARRRRAMGVCCQSFGVHGDCRPSRRMQPHEAGGHRNVSGQLLPVENN